MEQGGSAGFELTGENNTDPNKKNCLDFENFSPGVPIPHWWGLLKKQHINSVYQLTQGLIGNESPDGLKPSA